jgi:diguanylate cyclase (GGDEF)-like protein
VDNNKQTLDAILEALNSIILGKFDEKYESPLDDETSMEIFHHLNTLILHLKEISTVSHSLANGNLDDISLGRRNYLAAPLKTLHSRLSTLSWNANQTIKGKVAGSIVYDGELYQSINALITQIANVSLNQQEVVNFGDVAMNSWKYHKILLALNNLTVMVLLVNSNGEIIYKNEKAKTIFSEVTSFSEVKTLDNNELISFAASFAIKGKSRSYSREEIFDTTRNRWFSIVLESLTFLNNQVFEMFMISDVTDWKINEIKLQKEANTDKMTGLYNGRGGLMELRLSLQDFEEDISHCTAFIDLDGLKFINDTFGHIEGDFFIKKVADLLLNSSRHSDIVVRFGGDEFVVFFINCSYSSALTRLTNARKEFEEYNNTSAKPYQLGFSFGIVPFYNTQDLDILKVIEQADKEMYLDKKQRKSR